MNHYGDDLDELSWMPAPSQRRKLQLPLNLRSSTSDASTLAKHGSNYSRSSRLSSIFSESKEEDDDDPFDLKKLNNKESMVTNSDFCSTSNGHVGLLVQIDSEDESPGENSDLGILLEGHFKEGDSFLSHTFGASVLGNDATTDLDLNIAFADWDRIKYEASAIAGDLKEDESLRGAEPISEKLLGAEKLLELSSFSPGVLEVPPPRVGSPLAQLDDSVEVKFQLINLSPDEEEHAKPINEKFSKKMPLRPVQPINQPMTSSRRSVTSTKPSVASSKTSVTSSKASVTSSKASVTSSKASVTSSKKSGMSLKSSLTSSMKNFDDTKENINLSSLDEVFIDDQLDRAIQVAVTHRPNKVLVDKMTPSKRLDSTSSSLANTSIRDKSIIASTPVVASATKSRQNLFAPPGTGLATPIKRVNQHLGHNFVTPQARPRSVASQIAKSRLTTPSSKSFIAGSMSAHKTSVSGLNLTSSYSVTKSTSGQNSVSAFVTPTKVSDQSTSSTSKLVRRSLVQPSPARIPTSTARRSLIPASPLKPSSAVKVLPSTSARRSILSTPSICSKSAGSSASSPLISKPLASDQKTVSKLQTLRQNHLLRTKVVPSVTDQASDSEFSRKIPAIGSLSKIAEKIS